MLRLDDIKIEVRRVPSLIAQLKAFIGLSELEKKLLQVEGSLKVAGPVTREYWLKPNAAIWIGIDNASRIHNPVSLLKTDSPIHHAARLAAVLRVLEPTMPDWKAAEIRSRLVNDDVLAPLLIELTVASRYTILGFEVRWIKPEAPAGKKTFDMLIRRGDLTFEVECKAKTIDAGRKITRSRLYQLCDRLPRSILSRPFPGVFRAIDILVPDRVPPSVEWQQSLLSALENMERGGTGTLSDGTRLRVNLRELNDWADVGTRELELRLRGPFVQFVFLSDRPDVLSRPLMVMSLRSRENDRVVADIQDDLISALGQFSHTRLANIACYVPEVTSFEGCEAPSSAIATMSRRVFARSLADHLVSIDYVSDPIVGHIPGLSLGMHAQNLRFQNHRIDSSLVPPELGR